VKLLTVRQAAALLTVSPRKVYNLITTGKLPYYRIGRVIRIAQEDVDDYFSDCRVARSLMAESARSPDSRAKKPNAAEHPITNSQLKIGPRQLALLRRGGVGISAPNDRSAD
jgi:excisionase family DNA binding protein